MYELVVATVAKSVNPTGETVYDDVAERVIGHPFGPHGGAGGGAGNADFAGHPAGQVPGMQEQDVSQGQSVIAGACGTAGHCCGLSAPSTIEANRTNTKAR